MKTGITGDYLHAYGFEEGLKLMNTPTMRMCLDTGHAAVYGDSPAEAVRKISKAYLATLHVHDNDGQGDRHWLPGEGVIDWEDFTRALFAKVKAMADGTYKA